MIITYLKLKNWCQHQDLEVTFSPRSNGVVGSNGKGKSNLIKAVRVLLTGRTDSDDSLDHDITDGQTFSHLELGFVHDGISGVIKRKFYTNASNTAGLVWGDVKIDGITPVNKQLETMLGVNAETMEKYSFVAQDKLQNILFDTPSRRLENMIAMIPDIARSRTIRDRLERFMKTIPDITLPYDKEYLDSRKQTLQEALETNEKSIQDIQTTLSQYGDLGSKESVIEQYETAKRNCERVAELTKRQEASLTEISAKLQKRSSVAGEMHELPDEFDPDTVRAQLAEYKAFDHEAVEAAKVVLEDQALLESKTSLQTELERLSKLKLELEPIRDARHEDVSMRNHDLSSAEKSVKDWEKSLSLGDECPLCGSTLDREHTEKHLTEAKTALETAKGRLKEAEEAFNAVNIQYNEYQQDYLAKTAELSTLDNKLRRASEYLDSVKEPELYEWEAAKFSELLEQHDGNQASQRTLDVLDAELKSLYERTSQITEDITSFQGDQSSQVSDEEYEAAKARIREAQELDVQRRALEMSIQQTKVEIGQVEHSLDELVKAEQSKQDVDALKAKVTTMRDLLHRDSLPKWALQYYLDALRANLSHHLTKFGSPFSVTLGDDFSLTFSKEGQSNRSIKRLSGGEKSVVSTALHLAVSEMFNGNLRTLVLDEPSQNMDEEYINALTNIIEIATGGSDGRQLIVVTHHTNEMLAAFDNVIRL